MSNLIYQKIPEIMGKVGAIKKARQGSLSYMFRGIDDLTQALHGHLVENGVFFYPTVIGQIREERASKSGGMLMYTVLTVEYTFNAGDGSSIKLCTVGEAMDTSDKSCSKAMSSALKYALLQLFCIPTEEEKDTEYQNHEPVSKDPQPVKEQQAGVSQADQSGSFVFEFGKHKGKRLDSMDIYELNSWVSYMNDQTDLNGKAATAVAAAKNYLKSRETKK